MKRSALCHLDKAEFLQFIEGAPHGCKVGHTQPPSCVPNAKVKAPVILAIIQHGEFYQQGTSCSAKRTIGGRVQQAMIQPSETRGRVAAFLVGLVSVSLAHGQSLPCAGLILRTETGRPLPAAPSSSALSVGNHFDDGHS